MLIASARLIRLVAVAVAAVIVAAIVLPLPRRMRSVGPAV
jgi:hypothetical protein